MDQGVIRVLKEGVTGGKLKGGVPRIRILDTMKFLVKALDRVSKETIYSCFRCEESSLETQAGAGEDNDDLFKLLQSNLDEWKLLNPILVPDGTTTDDFTEADQALSVAESASIDNGEILNHYRESRSTDVTSDNNDEESNEELGSLKRPSQSEIFSALEWLQNCSLFEKEQVAFHLRSHLDKLSVLYEKTLRSKKQHTKIDTFLHR